MPNPSTQPVVVRARLTSPHPVVVLAREAAAKANPDETGRLELGQRGGVRLTVSRAMLPRVLRLLDALCKAIEERGWAVSAGTKHSGRGVIEVWGEGQRLWFTIVEATDKVPHVMTAKEESEVTRSGYSLGIPRWDQTPSGRLSLRFVEQYDAKRSTWNDGVRQRLEDLLGEVLTVMSEVFEARNKRQAEREKERQERAARQVVAVEAAYRRLVERNCREAAEEQVSRWRLHHDLRAYMQEVEAALPQMDAEARETTHEWLGWVTPYLADLDALLRAPRLPTPPDPGDPSLVTVLGGNVEAWAAWSRAASATMQQTPAP